MAVYDPRHISTQLCRLFDSGRCTVEQFAKMVEEPRDLIVKITNNPATKVTPELRLRMGRVLASWHRQYPDTKPPSEYDFEQQRNLRLVTEAAEVSFRDGTPRGVFEETDAPAGVKIFKSIGSTGVRHARLEVLAADIKSRQHEERILGRMESYLDSVDPVSDSVGSENI